MIIFLVLYKQFHKMISDYYHLYMAQQKNMEMLWTKRTEDNTFNLIGQYQ